MSKCVSGFAKVTVPVSYDENTGDQLSKKFYNDYVNNNNVDMCVKQCKNGTIPINIHEFGPNLKITDKTLFEGGMFTCMDLPDVEMQKSLSDENDKKMSVKCKDGYLIELDPRFKDSFMCMYKAPNYFLKK
jgi:hypothetical protein